MATKKPPPGQLKKFRHDVARLKALGLTSKRVDARSQQPTRHMRKKVALYSDVLAGKAKVVHTKTRAQASEIQDLRHFGKSVVVPVVNKSERVRYDPKRAEIVSYATENGTRVKKIHRAKNFDRYNKDTYPTGPNIKYRIPFAHGGSYTTNDLDDLFAKLFEYEHKQPNPYKKVYDFVQILYIEGASPDDDGDDE